MLRQRALTIALLCAPVALLGLASCSTTNGTASAASAPSTLVTTTDATTTVTPTDAATTTEAPTTTAVPSTTETPTTTAEPTTTEVPTPTVPPTTAPPTLPAGVAVPPEPVDPAGPFRAVGGSGGADTAAIQGRLLQLGFWLSGADGGYGLTTTQAVMAFQKYAGLKPSGVTASPVSIFVGSFLFWAS
jgi:outer membrane biosynthesis protein TonB